MSIIVVFLRCVVFGELVGLLWDICWWYGVLVIEWDGKYDLGIILSCLGYGLCWVGDWCGCFVGFLVC